MKQVQFTFQDDKKLEEELRKLRQWARSNFCSKVLIQICTEIPDRERIGHVCETIERLMPEALYAGCSSNGNIVNGDFSGGSIAVICTLFEYPSTHVEVLQYPLQADTQENVVQMLEAAMDERPWVKAVELLVTIRGMSMTTLCESLSHMWRQGIRRRVSFLSSLAEKIFTWRLPLSPVGSLSARLCMLLRRMAVS